MSLNYLDKAKKYLNHLCVNISNRHPGSTGNQQTANWLQQILNDLKWQVETQSFKCMDWNEGAASISTGKKVFDIYSGPYTLPFKGRGKLIVIKNIEELREVELRDRIVLLTDEIASGQLFPKNFVFYNPDEHKEIYRLLEEKSPAAVIAATGKNPMVAGSVYPFPMFEDGDFDIPNAYMKDVEGEKLKLYDNKEVELSINSERINSSGMNVLARKGKVGKSIVLTAHFDAKKKTPGALDNASGVIVLLLVAEMMRDYDPDQLIEIALLNGEDYYAASGEMEYIKQLNGNWKEIELCVNIDAAGCENNKVAISEMGCSESLKQKIENLIINYSDLMVGEPWYIGDHMMFVQQNVPAIAISSENLMELCRDITHTSKDSIEMVDPELLVETARFIVGLVVKN
ncbi:M28 family metallopeptidase [Candidatus Cloacimonadota bacterium]